jgi:GTP pyrophosphokinase
MVEAELKRMDLAADDLEGVIERFSLGKIDDLYVAVGNGGLTVSQVVHAAERLRSERFLPSADDLITRTSKRQRQQSSSKGDDIWIEGVGKLLSSIAKCCQPVPGDAVIGYVTRLRGVTIHRDDCRNVLRWQKEETPRLLEVSWGSEPAASYTVEILVRAYDRRELIKDISSTLATSEVSVTDISSKLDESSNEVEIRLQVKVRNYEQLSELLNRIGGIRNVLESRRLKGES